MSAPANSNPRLPLENLLKETLEDYKSGRGERGDKILKELTNGILERFPGNVYFLGKIMDSLIDIGQQEKASEFIENIRIFLKNKKGEIFSSKESSNEKDEMLEYLSKWDDMVENLSSLKRRGEAQMEAMRDGPSRNVRQRKVESKKPVLKDQELIVEGSVSKDKQERLSGHARDDKWVIDDKLGNKVYATGISAFLTHQKTTPPLTISIQAPWGGGKTSIMRMVQKELDPDGFILTSEQQSKPEIKLKAFLEKIKDPDELEKLERLEIPKPNISGQKSKMLSIWFNAWKYQNTEEIWAGLAYTIISQFSDRLCLLDREKFFAELNLRRNRETTFCSKINKEISRLWWEKIRKRLRIYLTGIGSSAIWFFIEQTGLLYDLKDYGWYLPILPALGVAFFIMKQRNEASTAVEDKNTTEVLGELVKVPDYRTNLGFIHYVDADIRRVLSIVNKYNHENNERLKLVIFIDDLDRCSPTKVAEVFEGLNMFISADYPDCFFVIGMDIEIVAAALEKAHSEIIEKMPKYSKNTAIGWHFIDKFVQMPIIIPPPPKELVKIYVGSLLLPAEQTNKIKQIFDDLKNDGRIDYSMDILKSEKSREKIVNLLKQHDIDPSDQSLSVIQQIITTYKMDEVNNNIIKSEKEHSDDNPEFQEQVTKAVIDFSNNPREIKRFLNVLRFNFFLRYGRMDSGLDAPTPDQLRRWIVLTMKWPQFVLWLYRTAEIKKFDKNSKDRIQTILEEFEQHSKDSNTWETMLNELLKINLENTKDNNILWIDDENLRIFFKEESEQKDDKKKISNASGTGLY